MIPTLYIMCGLPGSGKSYYAHEHYNNLPIVSRDEIRFAMLKENGKYFDNEKAVFNRYIDMIVANLYNRQSVVADATHLTMQSRMKLIHAIDKYFTDYKIVYVVMQTSIKTCLSNNHKREGLARVPDEVIWRMKEYFEFPYVDEDDRLNEIIII